MKTRQIFKRFHVPDQVDISNKIPWANDKIKNLVNFFLRVKKSLEHDKCFGIASSLAYTFILSLIPITAICFSFLSRFLSPATFGGNPEDLSALELKFQEFITSNFLPESISTINAQIFELSKNMGNLNFINVVILIVTILLLLNTIEQAFNHIWRVTKPRPFVLKFLAFWTTMTITPFLIGLSIFFTFKIEEMNLEKYVALEFFMKFMLTFGPSWAAFFLAYRLLPFTHVSWKAAALGGLVGGGLWELGKKGFDLYISKVTTYSTLYGSLGAIPIVFLWIYLTWVIVLIGAEVAAVYQYEKRKFILGGNWGGHREFLAARVILEIVKPFSKGEQVSGVNELSNKLDMSEELVILLCKKMEEKGLLSLVEGKEMKFIPAKETDLITLGEVVQAVGGHTLSVPNQLQGPGDELFSELFGKAEKSTFGILNEYSLKKLCEKVGENDISETKPEVL